MAIDPSYIGAIVGTLALLGVGIQVWGKRVASKDTEYGSLVKDRTELREHITRIDAELQKVRNDYWVLQTEYQQIHRANEDCVRQHEEALREIAILRNQVEQLQRWNERRGGV